jgi:hypothetical protein
MLKIIISLFPELAGAILHFLNLQNVFIETAEEHSHLMSILLHKGAKSLW